MILLIFLRAALFPRPALSEDGLTPEAQVAVGAVAAFYTLDYTASSELWISNVCAFSTDEGCQSIRSYFAPTIQALVQSKQIQTGCSVLPVRMIKEDGDIRIWQVRVTLESLGWVGLSHAGCVCRDLERAGQVVYEPHPVPAGN